VLKSLLQQLLKPHNFLRLSRTVLILVSLAACGKQSAKDIVKTKPVRLGHAQHFDIPTPVTFTQASQSSNTDTNGMIHDFMQYNGKLPIGQTIAFYTHEMERSGWDIVDLSGTREGFLFCTKPNKRCGVQIRANVPPVKQMPTTVCLFVTSVL